MTNLETGELARVFSALKFAAHKHRDQRRKDQQSSPYIKHPIEVAEVLIRIGGVGKPEVLMAALLHDTVEDTETSFEELAAAFGPEVASLVEEVTDDKSLPWQLRKRLQVERAPNKSPGAKLIKAADKICNLTDLLHAPPTSWDDARRLRYIDWAEQVFAGLRGENPALDDAFDEVAAQGRAALDSV